MWIIFAFFAFFCFCMTGETDEYVQRHRAEFIVLNTMGWILTGLAILSAIYPPAI